MADDNGTAAPAARAWHELTAAESLRALGASPHGLEEADAAARLKTHGPNRLPMAARRGPLVRFLLQFHNILIYVLLAAAVVTAFLQHWIDTGVIVAVVLANAVIGFIQEGKAENAMDAIRCMLAPHAAVLRGGKRRSVDGADLVPGDVVLLEAGDKAPADLRLLSAHGLHMQEALLTGESAPVEKRVEPAAATAPLGDRWCMVYSGTLATAGQGRGVVVATATATEIGRISGLLADVEEMTTPLVRQMNVFAQWLTGVILAASLALLLHGWFAAHFDFGEIFMVVVGLAVAAIPEGLPAVLTITLAAGVQAMARRNAVVRRLPAIETLGSVSVICTDKTGTLTRNEMMVATVVAGGDLLTVDGGGYAPQGGFIRDGAAHDASRDPALRRLALGCALCNDAALRFHDGAWRVEGDPMEGALLAFAGKAGVTLSAARLDAIPFDSKHRFMATLHPDADGEAGRMIFVKGAPERILEMCDSRRAGDGGRSPLDRDWWRETAERIAASGQRVLAVAETVLPDGQDALDHADATQGLALLGMVGLIDPPRMEAAAAVAECAAAGIRVKMITGDHVGTARAIARQIGLANAERALTGADIDRMDDMALKAAVLDADVFARTSPEHKLRLVTALQSHGFTVAMTGDGVNDAPALKRADAGVAMGCKGSEAAKEAAELVLLDDNFASIVAAVGEGRTVYDNIKKVVSWTLPTNAGEAATIVMALLAGLTLPMTAAQILWINLITAATLGLALAFEPAADNVMRRPPRPPGEPLLTADLAWHIIVVSALIMAGVYGMFTFALERGHSIEVARTIAVNTLVAMEIFHLFFIRNFHARRLTWKMVRGAPAVWASVLTATAAQFAFTYWPPFQQVFSSAPVPLLEGVLVVLTGVALFVVVEAEKRLRLRLFAKRAN